MLKPKSEIFDRIDQSFHLIRNNLFRLIFPLFILNFLFFWVWYLLVINYITWIIWGLDRFDSDNLLGILYSAEWVLVITVALFLWLLYAILYIPFLLATIRLIHLAACDERLDIKENIIFWFKNILNSFSTYWYIFQYIYLIPALIFIVWGLGFNISYFLELNWNIWDILKTSSISLMSIAFLLFIIFAIYRGLKATFVLYSAVSNNQFTQNNFNKNLKITDNNLLRILWNFLLIWFILWTVSKIFLWILSLFLPEAIEVTGLDNILNQENIWNILNNWWIIPDVNNFDFSNLDISFSYISYIISEFFTQLLKTIFTVFWFVFTYIFMKRLELESNEKLDLSIINETEKSEIEVDNFKNI